MIGIRGQIILALIPSFVTQLIAFYRVKKFTNGLIIQLIIFIIDFIIQMTIQWPFGLMFALPFTTGVPVYFVRKWTMEYNHMSKDMFS